MIGMKTMMPCEEVLARLYEFVDGELPADEQDAVRRHLEMCERCYPRYDFQRAWLEYERRMRDAVAAPASLRRTIFMRLLEQESRGVEG